MNSEIYKEFYKFEWDQRSNITSAVNIPIVVITVLGGTLATMLVGYPYSSKLSNFTQLLFIAFILVSTLCLIFSVYSIFRSLITSKYEKIASPLVLREHFEKLSKWYQNKGDTLDAAQQEFQDNLNLKLAEATEVNATNNQNRSVHIFLATISLSIAVAFLACAAVLYVVANVESEEKIHMVKIVK